jgi:hypothetical protein
VPLAIGRFPVLPALGAVASIALLTRLPVTALLAGAGLVAIIAAVYVVISRPRDGDFGRRRR